MEGGLGDVANLAAIEDDAFVVFFVFAIMESC